MDIRVNSTSQRIHFRVLDGDDGVTGLLAADFTLWYHRAGDALTSITPLTDVALDDDFAEGGIAEVDDGWYEVHVPDAAFVTGADRLLLGGTATTGTVVSAIIDIVDRQGDAATGVTGPATQSDMELIFGADNISTWADLDNDGNATNIANRITWALSQATIRVRSNLDAGKWSDYETDELVVDVIARMAGCLLYEGRGVSDAEDEDNPMTKHEAYVEKTLARIQAGQLSLTAASQAYSSIPGVVDFDE